MKLIIGILLTSSVSTVVSAFQIPPSRVAAATRAPNSVPLIHSGPDSSLYACRTLTKERPCIDATAVQISDDEQQPIVTKSAVQKNDKSNSLSRYTATATAAAVAIWTVASEQAVAAGVISEGNLNPENFAPVCSVSDGFYRFLQQSTVYLVGEQSFVEYGPLIAGGLLRIRLELCVIESFFNEAVGPFIAKNGVSWILPLHETVETFLAGLIFALATAFISIGSTKILNVIATYTDFLIGAPARLFGGFTFDRASGKPVTLDVGFGPFKTRLVGPPKEVVDQQELELSKVAIPTLVILFVSGTIKFFGQTLGVRIRYFCVFLFGASILF